MAEELLASRRKRNDQIRNHMEYKGINISDHHINKIRLNSMSHSYGVNPTWDNKKVSIRDNELSAKAEKELLEDTLRTKRELRSTMASNGMLKFNKVTAFATTDVEENPPTTQGTTIQQIAQNSYRKLKEQQARDAEVNIQINRLTAHQIHNTTKESSIGNETFNEMINCNVDGYIESHKDHLEKGHKIMYCTNEYQQIVNRRKGIQLCEDTAYSENDDRTVTSVLNFEKDTVDKPIDLSKQKKYIN